MGGIHGAARPGASSGRFPPHPGASVDRECAARAGRCLQGEAHREVGYRDPAQLTRSAPWRWGPPPAAHAHALDQRLDLAELPPRMTHSTKYLVQLKETLKVGGGPDLASESPPRTPPGTRPNGTGRPAARGRPRTVRPRRPRPAPFSAEEAAGEGRSTAPESGHHGRLRRPGQDRQGRGMSRAVTVIGSTAGPRPHASQALAAARLVVGGARSVDAVGSPPSQNIEE